MRNQNDLGTEIARAGWAGLGIVLLVIIVGGGICAAIAAGLKGILILVGIVVALIIVLPAEARHRQRLDSRGDGDDGA